MTLMPLTLKSADGARELAVDLELDREQMVVTMHMLELDSQLVCEYLSEQLPSDYGFRVDDATCELFIALAGRRHPASLIKRGDGCFSLLLGDPDATYLERCGHAISQVLEALSGRGIDAVVTGIDRYGRAQPNEGFIHLFALANGRQEQEVIAVAEMVGNAYKVDLITLGFQATQIANIKKYEPHFAWDAANAKVARRNWVPIAIGEQP